MTTQSSGKDNEDWEVALSDNSFDTPQTDPKGITLDLEEGSTCANTGCANLPATMI